MILDVIVAFILQSVFTVGIIFLFGWLIALCNKCFYANFGHLSQTVCYVTGFIGTPVHELSHALFCIIFGHKIVEIKLFQINSADGTLGYVNHSYNPKNIYHRVGNFFIGVAPIIVISAILYLAAYLLLPPLYNAISDLSCKMTFNKFSTFFDGIGIAVGTFFSLAYTWQWWVFLILGIFLSLHMTLSSADIKGALSGLFLVLGSFLIVDIVLAIVGNGFLIAFTQKILSMSSYLLCFLILALLISLLALGISFLLRIKILKH